MERFLARIPDDLLIFDYQSKQKISGQEWKQDVAVAMDALASYNTIVLAEQNSYHWVVVLCACMCSGKTLHILDKSADICKICKYVQPDLLLVDDGDYPGEIPTCSAQMLLQKGIGKERKPQAFREGMICLYTTGTARESRSITFSGRQAADTALLQGQELGLDKLQSIGILPPFSHAYGLSAMLSALQCTREMVILRDSLSLFQLLRSEDVQGLFVQPAVLQIAATHPAALGRLAQMHLVACAGAKLEPAIHAHFQEQGIPVVNIYGSTETGMCFIGATAKGGTPDHFFLSGCMNLQLSDDDELLVQGSNIGNSQDAETPLLDEQGWYHTGDLAKCNPDGSFSIIGRKGDVVVLNSGYKINIEQLEATVVRITAAEDCQILVQSTMGVDQLALIVQGSLEISLPELNRQLNYYEQITRIKQVSAIRRKRGKKIRMTKERIMLEMAQIIDQIAPEKGVWENIPSTVPFFHTMGFNSLTSLQFILSMEEKLGITIDILEFDLQFTLEQLIVFLMEQTVTEKEA